jgi:hypothetical protein
MFKQKKFSEDDRLQKIQDDIEAIKKSHQQIIDLLKQKEARGYVLSPYPDPRVPNPIPSTPQLLNE